MQVAQEGESTWFEGLQLLAVYVVLGLTFYFVGMTIPPAAFVSGPVPWLVLAALRSSSCGSI